MWIPLSFRLFYYSFIFITLIIQIKAEDEEGEETSPTYQGPVQLNIYLDLYNFEENFENTNLGDTKEIFKAAMNNAKNILESIFLIDADPAGIEMEDNYKDNWGLSSWNSTMFRNGENIYLTTYNYFIFFKFESLIDCDMTSKIVLTYTQDMPLMGLVKINSNIDNSKLNKDYLNPLMLQQFIRVLGFHGPTSLANSQFDGIMKVEEEDQGDDQLDIEQKIINNCYIDSPKVIEYAQKYFNCSSIEEIYMEKDRYNNFYWPSRYFLGEIMAKIDDYKEKVISKFTLAFMEDLEYLIVKNDSYLTGGLMRFGKHKGCDFFQKTCGEDNINELVFSNEFYLPTGETANNLIPSCSSNRLGKTIYVLHEIDSSINLDDLEYRNEGFTGLKQTNYCPFAEYEYETSSEFSTGFCSDSNTAKNSVIHEKTGSDSFCVLSSLITNAFTSVCYKMICSSRSLTIEVGEKYIVCPRTGGRLKPIDIDGYILCPDYNLICTGNDNKICNNYIDCINNGIYEKEDTLEYDYDIKTTQNYEINEGEEPELVTGWEESDDGFCPKYCRQCGPAPDKKCDECAPGYKIYNEADNQCLEIVPNCKEYVNNFVCQTCKDDFFLAEEDNSTLICEQISTRSEYYYPKEGEDYKVKCKKHFDNCYTCDTTQAKCLTCLENYGLLDGGSRCVDKSSTLYYKEGDVYKLCSEYTPEQNCNKCQITEGGEYKCLECKENYGYVHEDEESVSCQLLSSLPDKKYYTEDNINYYKCENNDIDNCSKCESKNKCLECKEGFTTANDGQICISNTDIENNLYYNDPTGSSFYYLCKTSLNNCLKCESKTKCIECDSSIEVYKLEENDNCIPQTDIDAKLYYEISTDRYASCSKISNCEKCTSAENCILCQSGFNFEEGDDNKITCQNIDLNNYYKKTTTDKEYYRKCSKDIENCNKCTDSTHCTECKENYAIVEDNYQFCRDLSSGKYYYNNEKYKLCSNGFPNCELCIMIDNNLKCTKCLTNFALKHDSNVACAEQTSLISLEASKTFYSNDSGINYYSCSDHNDVKNCNKCNNDKTCEECNSGYDLENNKTLCASKVDKDNHLYAYNPSGELKPCNSLIPNCNSCENYETCLNCEEGSGLIDINKTCVSESIIEQEHVFYKDEITGNYISCSVIENCITCSSSSVCTSCQTGFKINSNNICEKINDSKDDDKGLSTGAIVGIVIGCVAFLVLVAFLAYYIYNKFFVKSNNAIQEKVQKTDGIIVNEQKKQEKQEKQEDPEKEEVIEEKTIPASTTKRTIHNIKNYY